MYQRCTVRKKREYEVLIGGIYGLCTVWGSHPREAIAVAKSIYGVMPLVVVTTMGKWYLNLNGEYVLGK